MTVQGKTALVTGGTSGIGEAIARAYAAAGADVVITGRDRQRGERIVDSLAEDGAHARFVQADLEREEDVRRLAEQVEHIDVLVNNAGAFPFGATHEVDGELLDATFALNVKAPFLLAGAFAPRMAENGGGAIVNVTTMVASLRRRRDGALRLDQGRARAAYQGMGSGVRGPWECASTRSRLDRPEPGRGPIVFTGQTHRPPEPVQPDDGGPQSLVGAHELLVMVRRCRS
jgi:NAD(P)-dependent dehydrogenase (short-subunit alcohol dehydrogenase family)